MKNTMMKRFLSVLLCMALILSYLPGGILKSMAAGVDTNALWGEKKADGSTMDTWQSYFGPNKMDTEFAGAVWTDKSVFGDVTPQLPGVTLGNPNNFLVALSAIASNLSITGHTTSPTDTMLVLDMSGSMVDDTYQVGYTRQGNNYRQTSAIDMSLIEAMVDATNATIQKLMDSNANNRVGVVLYSGNTSTNSAATTGSATVVLPLGRYAGVNGAYLSVDATYTTAALYEYKNRQWRATGETATYVSSDSSVAVSVANGLKTEAGSNVTDRSKTATGGTYMQNGLYQAMQQFLSVTDTVVPEGNVQAGTERLPVLVLMTDGAPTIATTAYSNIGSSNVGDGSTTNDRITFLTQLTAAYVRGKVAEHYRENDADEVDILFMTLGLGTENSTAATETLYPAGSNNTLKTYWETYLRATGANATIYNGFTVKREAAVTAMNYVDKYFYASDAQGLVNSFSQIFTEISLKAESYATLVEGGNANFSGYVTFVDELGEMMQVYDMKGILMDDGNGGTVLYTGKGVAKSLNEGVLGTVDQPTERGNELVATVKERIPGTTTTQAQQLISYAYQDGQLYYTDDDNWSNYIGWYADADGNYVGFWDKDSGYDNAPEGAVYANCSYGYLGALEDTDMMHVVVMVRTELATQHQTVFFKIPASLLPTVQYKVTLNQNDANSVDEFIREEAVPMRLVFETGLRAGVNAVNLEQKIAEHLATGGHIHRNETTGAVTFYTNQFSIGNDKNQNGIPDQDEIDTAVVTESHFHPAVDNSRYYFIDDTPVLDAGGNPVTATARPAGTGYINEFHIYSPTGRTTLTRPIAEATLAKAVYENGQWIIPKGTMLGLERFREDKVNPQTDSLSYYFFPAAFEENGKQDVYSFLGNNGSFTVYPATGITLRKEIQGTITDESVFAFRVTLSGVPAGETVTPVLTDANGDALSGVTLSPMGVNSYLVTMPADVTAYISGIPVGTQVQVEEEINGDYKIVSVQVADKEQSVSAPATATVPGYEAGVSQMVSVVITNAPNAYGNLVISKDVVHDLAADPDAMSAKEFTFQLTLSGAKITENMTFHTSAGVDVKVGANGVVTFVDGSPIVLKDEESITIQKLPEGTAYIVTESDLPGFQLDSINGDTAVAQASGVIPANDTSLAQFVNRYPDDFAPVEVPLTVNVNKILNELTPYPGDEEFVFVLQQLLPDNTHPNIAATNGAEYLKVSKNASGEAAFKLTFEDMGTYFFRVVELKPSEQTPAGTDTPGMTYSTTRALFEVVVTDADMDGVLEIAVSPEANISVNATYNGSDPEKITGVGVEATFTNEYEVGSTNTTLNVHKTLNNETGAVKPLTGFRFNMVASDAQGNVIPGAQVTTVTASALGDATFNIFLHTAGTYYYKITELIPEGAVLNARTGKYDLNGMSYDATAYLYKIVVQPNADTSNLEVVERTLVNLSTNTPVNPENGVYTARFVNDYNLKPDEIVIPISKELTGRAPAEGEIYQGLLVQTDGAFNPLTGNAAWSSTYTLPYNVTSDVKLTFDKVGSYHYKFTEILPDAVTLNPATGEYVRNGVIYDTSEYHITVTVSDKGNGALDAAVVIHRLGDAQATNVVKFTNRYTVTGTAEVVIGGEKILNGRAMVAGEFTMGLYTDASCQKPIATAANRADGTFRFPAISYTVADLGANYGKNTVIYYVKEIPGTRGGVEYDDNTYTVTVVIDHKDGVLTATSADALSLKIRNTYKADPVKVTLNGKKVLSGDWTSVPNKTFRFDLFTADGAFAITNQTPLSSKYVEGAGVFTMELNFTDGQEGNYYYVLKENISARAGGIGYDAGEYHITVRVSDPGEGKLAATVTMYRPGTGNTTTAVFTNVYSVVPTTVTLQGTKSLINTSTGLPKAMNDGDFTFAVLEGDALVTTGESKADGTIAFQPIRYTAPGVHTYTVVEDAGAAGGVEYSEQSFTVTVTVVDNGNGTLTATADYGTTPIAFVNTYTPGTAQVTLSGKKEYEGDWSAVSNKVFNFELFETDSTFTVNGTAKLVATNDAGDSFTFGTLSYTTAGTYYYVIREENYGQTLNGITYASKEIRVTVVVTDNGDGMLIPTVTTDDANVTATTLDNVAAVENMVFTNTYKASAATHVPSAQKVYEGGDMKEFDFVLALNGIDIQVKQNDAQGKILFDEVRFEVVGTYKLTIREQENALWDLIRWDTNVYTVTLYVEDNGRGELFVNDSKTTVESENERLDLVFRNAHHDVITQKEVFEVHAPTVSVDGRAVEAGDVLLYKISYTNYTGKKADVTITDTIPQYTKYVADSADHGGVLDGGVLTWVLTDIPADGTVTVSFQVEVTSSDVSVTNQAVVLEGQNTIRTNETTTEITPPSDGPDKTGDNTPVQLMFTLMLSSVACVAVLLLTKKRLFEQE